MPEHVSKSTRTTGSEPTDAIDPGGTRPTKGRAGKALKTAEQKVVSGDRNDHKTSTITTQDDAS